MGHRPVVFWNYGRPYIKLGGHRSVPSPVFGFIICKQGAGTALYSPLCLVLRNRGGNCLTSPVFSFILQGDLLTPVFSFMYELVWRLEETVSDTPPPPSGGSKLNISTYGVEIIIHAAAPEISGMSCPDGHRYLNVAKTSISLVQSVADGV